MFKYKSRVLNMANFNGFIYLGFYVAFNTVQVISRRVVERAEETSTYSSSGFCTVNCRPTASNYQLSHLRSGREPNLGLRGGRGECYHSAIVVPQFQWKTRANILWVYTQDHHFIYFNICLVFLFIISNDSTPT